MSAERLFATGFTIVLVMSGAGGCRPQDPAPRFASEVVLTGSPLSSTTGLSVDRQGRLLVTSAMNNSLTLLDPGTGERLGHWDTANGVVSPDDVAVGEDGTIFWTEIYTGQVKRMTPDGRIVSIANLGAGVNAIRLSPSGNTLYVSKAMLGDGLYAIDPSGVDPPELLFAHMGWSNSMAFGPDGAAYAPLVLYGAVVRYDFDARTHTTIAEGFAVPQAVDFDSNGNLFVLDRDDLTRIYRVDVASGEQSLFAALPHGGDNLTIDEQDRVFVTNLAEGGVVEALGDGRTREVLPAGLVGPAGIDIRHDNGREVLVVNDLWSLREYDIDTAEPLNTMYAGFPAPDPPAGAPPYSYADPFTHGFIYHGQTLRVQGDRALLTSWFANIVQEVDLRTRRVIGTWRGIDVPIYALEFRGDVIVSELGSGSVLRIERRTRDAVPLVTGLLLPGALAARDNNLYASDWATGRILQIVAAERHLSEPRLVTTLDKPEGMTFDHDGTLLVVESGKDRLVRVDPRDGHVQEVSANLGVATPALDNVPPSMFIADVSVAASGDYFVTAGRRRQVLRIRRVQDQENH